MPTDQTPSTYTDAERSERGAAVGEAIMSLIDSLRADAAETLHRVADIQAAWAERDWTWLVEAGVVRRSDLAVMMGDDAAAPTSTPCCVCTDREGVHPFDASSARYCGRCASDLGLTLTDSE